MNLHKWKREEEMGISYRASLNLCEAEGFASTALCVYSRCALQLVSGCLMVQMASESVLGFGLCAGM